MNPGENDSPLWGSLPPSAVVVLPPTFPDSSSSSHPHAHRLTMEEGTCSPNQGLFKPLFGTWAACLWQLVPAPFGPAAKAACCLGVSSDSGAQSKVLT